MASRGFTLAVATVIASGSIGSAWAQATGAARDPHADHAPTGTTSAAHHALDSLAAETATRTARYADRRAAVGDGYRRLGTDFPGMGEHWLHPGVLLAGRIDAARPTLLTYATIDGKPTLLGVGFVVTTRGDSEMAGVPGWPDEWHEHSGLLADESGARAGQGDHAGTGAAVTATRVWVLHVWTALANPDGRYAADNWALPFARVGLAAPADAGADAARAVSLVAGGDAYLRDVLSDAGARTAANATAVDEALRTARDEAARVVTRAGAAGRVGSDDVAALRAVWRALDQSLTAATGGSAAPFLAPPHGASRRGAASPRLGGLPVSG